MRRNVKSLEAFDQAPQRIRLIKGITNFETSRCYRSTRFNLAGKLEAIRHSSNLKRAYLTPYAMSLSGGCEDTLRDQALHSTKHKL